MISKQTFNLQISTLDGVLEYEAVDYKTASTLICFFKRTHLGKLLFLKRNEVGSSCIVLRIFNVLS